MSDDYRTEPYYEWSDPDLDESVDEWRRRTAAGVKALALGMIRLDVRISRRLNRLSRALYRIAWGIGREV